MRRGCFPFPGFIRLYIYGDFLTFSFSVQLGIGQMIRNLTDRIGIFSRVVCGIEADDFRTRLILSNFKVVEVQVLDIANPPEPVLVGSIHLPGAATSTLPPSSKLSIHPTRSLRLCCHARALREATPSHTASAG